MSADRAALPSSRQSANMKPLKGLKVTREWRRCRTATIIRCCQQQQFAPQSITFLKRPNLFQTAPQVTSNHSNCTLCSQLSLDRWPRWAQQAESWAGPLSVAVYIPAPFGSPAAETCTNLALALAEGYSAAHPGQFLILSTLYANHYAKEGTAALQSLPGVTAEQHPLLNPNAPYCPNYDQLYPINALRNVALSQAATPLVLCADGDFIFSQGLQDKLSEPELQQTLLHKTTLQQPHKHHQAPGQHLPAGLQQPSNMLTSQHCQHPISPVMLVLPAFQLTHTEALPDNQTAVVPRTKADLAYALASGTVEPFHCGVFAPKQPPIDMNAWLAATYPYEVEYCEYFEPQGVAVKQQLPLYDESFRGYGLNKVQHAWHSAQLGFKFLVLPNAFMVTAPHKRSSSWRPTPGTASDTEHIKRIQLVYEQFKLSLSRL